MRDATTAEMVEGSMDNREVELAEMDETDTTHVTASVVENEAAARAVVGVRDQRSLQPRQPSTTTLTPTTTTTTTAIIPSSSSETSVQQGSDEPVMGIPIPSGGGGVQGLQRMRYRAPRSVVVGGDGVGVDDPYLDGFSEDEGGEDEGWAPHHYGSIIIQSSSSGNHDNSGVGGGGPREFIVAPRPDGSAAVLAVNPNTGVSTVFVVPRDSTGADTLATLGQTGFNHHGDDDDVVHGRMSLRRGVDVDVQNTWRMSRTIRIYAIADFILCLFSMVAWVWFGLLAVFPIVGFVAALRYRLAPTIIFICYFPLAIAARIYITVVEAEKKDKESNDKLIMGIGIAFGVLAVLLELYYLRLVILFFRQKKKIGQINRDDLSDGVALVDPRYAWW